MVLRRAQPTTWRRGGSSLPAGRPRVRPQLDVDSRHARRRAGTARWRRRVEFAAVWAL